MPSKKASRKIAAYPAAGSKPRTTKKAARTAAQAPSASKRVDRKTTAAKGLARSPRAKKDAARSGAASSADAVPEDVPAKISSQESPSRSAQARRRSNGADQKTDFERANGKWHLRLYVAGDSPRSRIALNNLRFLCSERLKEGDYEIEVIDLTRLPHLAKADQILAVPTLVRSIPEPMKRIIGDLSNADRALLALDFDTLSAKPS